MGWFADRLHEKGHQINVLTTSGSQKNCPTTYAVSRTLRIINSDIHGPFSTLWRSINNKLCIYFKLRTKRHDVVFCGGFDGIGFSSYAEVLKSKLPVYTWLGDTWLSQAWSDLPKYDRLTGICNANARKPERFLYKFFFLAVTSLFGVYNKSRPIRVSRVGAISKFVLDNYLSSGASVKKTSRLIPVSLHPIFFNSSGMPIGHSHNRSIELRALFVGRMEIAKGPDTAIRALKSAVSNGSDVTLSFAGIGTEKIVDDLSTLAANLGVLDRIRFLGTPTLTNLVDIYRNHDVFLFPSRITEGLGVVNAEAIACGLPVIGATHSGSAEIILDGKTGFSVHCEDFETMGSRLTKLHSDRQLLEHLSATAPEHTTRFHPDRVISLLETELFDCQI